jgi:transforming growth factor-beta-induced protein
MKRSLLMLLALFVLFAAFSPAAGAEDKPMPAGESVATVDQSTGQWYLRNDDGSAQEFYFGDPGDVPLFGDWDGDTVTTPGVYRQSDGRIYLRNSNTQGIGDLWFFFGNEGDVPLAGDWDGDGVDTISVFRPSTNQFFIINELGADGGGLGAADYSFTFGDTGDVPFSGDWDGDGIDGVALHRESTGQVFFRNSLSTGVAEASTVYGDPGDMMIGGDWNGNGVDTLGVYRNGTFYLENTPVKTGTGLGAADETLAFGLAGFYPLAGFFMSQIGTGSLNIIQTAEAAGNFTTLLAALDATGLDQALRGPGPFTVFAPTDGAFDALPDGTVEALLGDLDALTRILKYHVVSGEVPASEVVKLDGMSVETIGGELVWIEVKDGKVILNDVAEVVITDVYASNGIIHVIDAVLVPQDIVEAASANPDFSTLVAALGAAGLADALSAPNGPYTVFAPTNDAFAALPKGVVDGLLADISALQRVLKYHVASGLLPASEVVNLYGAMNVAPAPANVKSLETIGGELVWIEVKDGKVYVNDAEVIITDIKTSNGIIHVIDAVLAPQDIVETASANPDFSTLVAALGAAGLADALSAPNGPYTVFAPTNEAFAALPDGVVDGLLADIPALTSVLTYHVFGDVYDSTAVVSWDGGTTPATLNGATIEVDVHDPTVVLNDSTDNSAEIVVVDVRTSNGIMHVINAVLIPPAAAG